MEAGHVGDHVPSSTHVRRRLHVVGAGQLPVPVPAAARDLLAVARHRRARVARPRGVVACGGGDDGGGSGGNVNPHGHNRPCAETAQSNVLDGVTTVNMGFGFIRH